MPQDRPLSALGVALYEARGDDPTPVKSILRTHGLSFDTWLRLVDGRLTKGGSPPRRTTVARYAQAVGLDPERAVELAERTYGRHDEGTAKRFGAPQEMTRLGSALEACRLETGMDTRPFLHARGVSVSTWYRLLRTLTPPARPTRHRATVVATAAAVGLDVERALALYEEDLRSGTYPDSQDTASDGR